MTLSIGVVLLVLGVAGVTRGFAFSFSGALIVTGGLQIAADLRYIPRAIRAARHPEVDRASQAP